jgi:hypothetical protein
MLDRYDPRDEQRAREESFGRELSQGSRGATEKRTPSDFDSNDPRDTFVRDVDLPREPERERVRNRDRSYDMNGEESRLLATVGAFRVAQIEDLRSAMGQGEGRRGVDAGVRHLRASGLVDTVRLDGRARDVAVLTDAGRDLLEANRRDIEGGARQEFHAGVRRVGRAGVGSRSGLQKPRELSHDSRIYSAYLRTEARIRSDGGRVRRIVLDHELKRDYQRFLHEGNRARSDSTGRPQRTRDEVATWARQRGLPVEEGRVRFPDVRVEYEDRHGWEHREDLEVVTPHYRGAHGASARASGSTCYVTVSGRSGGRGGGGRCPRPAEELLG